MIQVIENLQSLVAKSANSDLHCEMRGFSFGKQISVGVGAGRGEKIGFQLASATSIASRSEGSTGTHQLSKMCTSSKSQDFSKRAP